MALTSRHGRFMFLGLVAALFFPQTVIHAAEITDVIDAADKRWIGGRDNSVKYKEDPFDMTIGVSFSHNIKNGIISRESTRAYPSLVEEMDYKYRNMTMNFDIGIGLYHDLALYVGIPLILSETHNYSFAENVGTGNSSVYKGYSGDANLVPFSLEGNGYTFAHGASIGNISFGLKWSPLNDERDPSVATWTLGFAYEAPTGPLYDPSTLSLSSSQISNGRVEGLAVGDKAHRLNFSIAMSKRMFLPKKYALDPEVQRRGFIDPYFMIFYSLPLAGSDAIAADPAARNHDGRISRYQPSHIGGMQAGMEIVPYEHAESGRKVVLDFGVYGTYISEGRGYSAITDALRSLTYYENYMRVGGHFSLTAHFVQYVALKAGVSIGHETAHFLTTENAGEDMDGDNQVMKNTADYFSPYYNGSWDQVGYRFRLEQVLDFSYSVSLIINF